MRNSILTFIFFLLWSGAYAQVYEVPLKQRIGNATHIFEGEVLSSESYWNRERTMIYTAHRVKVQTLFKGDVGSDEISVITKGGWVGEDGYDITHHLILKVGDLGVFFCENARKYPTLPNSQLQSFQVYAEQQGFLRYHFDGLNPALMGVFDRYQHPEKELFAVIEKETGQKRVKLNPIFSEQKFHKWLEDKGVTVYSPTEFGVEYSIDNAHITGNFGQYLEFDIKLATTSSTYTYGGGEIFLDYNASVFGNDIVANNQIQVTKETIILSTDYSINASDVTSSKLKIDVNTVGTGNLYDIDNIPERLCHVVLNISNMMAGNPGVSFDEPSMWGLTEYFSSVTNTFEDFPYIVANDSINAAWALLFVPQIDSISPDTVPAGTGTSLSHLSIYGSGFGGFTQKGYVLFQSAEDTLPHWIYAHKGDIMNWSNTFIKVKVPSVDSLGTSSAATGRVMVETTFGLKDTSDEVLEVPYSVKNGGFVINNSTTKIPYRFIKMNPSGGLTFYFNQNFPPVAQTVFTAALDEWRCKTGLNYIISPTTTILDSIDVSNADTTGVVSFGDLPMGINAVTERKLESCLSGTFPKFYIEHADMIFQDTTVKDWYISMGTAGITNIEKDFYSTCVHELGHAHLLEHSQWKDKIMFPYGYNGNNGIKRTISNSEETGGLFVMSISKTQIACNNGTTFDSVTTYICSINSIDNPLQIKELKFYPNPSTGTIYINCKDLNIDNLQITDELGRVVYQNQNLKYQSQVVVNLAQLATGFYTITCTSNQQTYVGKLWIQE